MHKQFPFLTVALALLVTLLTFALFATLESRDDVSAVPETVDSDVSSTAAVSNDRDDSVVEVQLVATPMVTSASRQEIFLAQGTSASSRLDSALLMARAVSPMECFTLGDVEGNTITLGATDMYALGTLFANAMSITGSDAVFSAMSVEQQLLHTMALDPADALLWYCVVDGDVYLATAITYPEREFYVDTPRMVRVLRLRYSDDEVAMWQYAPVAARGDWLGPMTTAPIIYHDALYIVAHDESDRGTRTWAYYRFDEMEMHTLESCTAWGDPGTGEAHLSCDVTSIGVE